MYIQLSLSALGRDIKYATSELVVSASIPLNNRAVVLLGGRCYLCIQSIVIDSRLLRRHRVAAGSLVG